MSGKDVVKVEDRVPRYTQTDLDNARTKGQIIGWLQGGGATFMLMFVIGLIGVVPGLLVAAGFAIVLYVDEVRSRSR
jgi:hypothetical protein